MTLSPESVDIDMLTEQKPEFLIPEATEHITKVCFVCTGNTCRSPMAQAVYNDLFKNKNSYAISCGLFPSVGECISQNAIIALKNAGIENTGENNYISHKAKSVSENLLCDCDYIIGISISHTLSLMSSFPQFASKIYSMPKSISDPYGGDIETYKQCLNEIINGIKEFFNYD